MKKINKIAIGLLIATTLTCLMGIYSITSSAGSDESQNSPANGFEKKAENAKNKIELITNKEFGDVKFNKTENINGKELIYGEDNSYTYRTKSDSGDLVDLTIKNYDAKVRVVNKGKSRKDIESISLKKLLKYYPLSQGCSYTERKYSYKDTKNEKTHQLIFDEVASNDVKTGKNIAMNFNNDGELVLTAFHEGNLDVALNSKKQLSKEKAVEVVNKSIEAKIGKINGNISINVAELTVWQDNLSWHIEIGPVEQGSCIYGFTYFIDAANGNILFNDDYTKLK